MARWSKGTMEFRAAPLPTCRKRKLSKSGVSAASKVDSSITLDSERANALGAFLSMDKYSPDALVASLEVFT